MTSKIENDQNKLLGQWQADIEGLRSMVEKMENQIDAMRAEGEPENRISLRQEMIEQYQTTIAKLQALVDSNNV